MVNVVVTQLVVDASGSKKGVDDYVAAMEKAKKAAIETGDALKNSFERVQAQWTNSLAKIDPAIKAQIAMEKDLARQREISANAVKLGITTQEAANVQLLKLTQYHKDLANSVGGATKAATAHTNATKLQRYEMINFGRQIQDVFVSLFSGQSPLTVAVQQGTQIGDIAASSGVSLTNMFKQAGAAAISFFVQPVRIAIATVGALTAAATALGLANDRANVSAQRSITGAGQRTGTTATDLNQFTAANSSAFGLSAGEARQLGEGFTATGDIVISKVGDMNAAIVGFANQTNKSVSDAIKDFQRFGSDPKKAMEELSAVFGPVDEKIRKLVDLQSLGTDKTAAFNTVLDAYADKLKAAADNATLLERAQRFFAGLGSTSKFAGASGPDTELEGVRRQLNSAIESAGNGPTGSQAAALSDQIARLTQEMVKLQEAREAALGATAKAQFDAANTDAARLSTRVSEIIKAWGGVRESTALALQAMQNQLPVAQAWTEAARMRAQQQATYNNLIDKAKTSEEASALAAKEYALSKAAAVASAQQQVQSSQDNLDLARAEGTEMERVVRYSIDFRNAMQAGANETQAAAIASNNLAANLARAAKAAEAQSMGSFSGARTFSNANEMSAAFNQVMSPQDSIALLNATVAGGANAPVSSHTSSGGDPRVSALLRMKALDEASGVQGEIERAYASGSLSAAIRAVMAAPNMSGADPGAAQIAAQQGYDLNAILGAPQSNVANKISAYDSLIQLQNSQTKDPRAQAGNLQSELAWLQTLPSSIARDQKIADLTQSIEQLIKSTDGLNATNSELLSPYYTQDPRTSHIGFRSQGMASTGYIDIPGTPSANDNMTLTLPVASGERVHVGNGPNRGGGVTINMPITIQGNANKDDVGRTLYQAGQSLARQLQASSR